MKKQLLLVCVVSTVFLMSACDKLNSKKEAVATDTPVVSQSIEEASFETADAKEFAMAVQNVVAGKDLYAFADHVSYPIKVTYSDVVVANSDELKALSASEVLNDAFAVDVLNCDVNSLVEESGVYTCGSDTRYVKFVWSDQDDAFFITEIVNPK